jgi:hypothetical protein
MRCLSDLKTVYLYLQYTNIKTIEVCEITNNGFGKYVYFAVQLSALLQFSEQGRTVINGMILIYQV